MVTLKFNNHTQVDIKDVIVIIQLIAIIGAIAFSWATLPQKILAEANARYASRERVDALAENIAEIKGKIDRIYEHLMNLR